MATNDETHPQETQIDPTMPPEEPDALGERCRQAVEMLKLGS